MPRRSNSRLLGKPHLLVHDIYLVPYQYKLTWASILADLSYRPTHEQRQEIIRQLNSSVEQAKNAVRKARTEGMNALGGRSEPGSDEVEKLASEYGSALGELMDQAKKEFEKV